MASRTWLGWALGAALAASGLMVAGWLALGARPDPAEGAREVVTAEGYVVVVRPSAAGERLEIWRGRRLVWTAPAAGPDGAAFARYLWLSADMDVGGGPAVDLVAVATTGGAQCCATYLVVDLSRTLAPLGAIGLGEGEPQRFFRSTAPGLTAASLPATDDAAVAVFGQTSFAPLARVFVAWRGDRWGLDLDRMRAPGPDRAPAFWTRDPAARAALARTAVEGDFQPPAGEDAGAIEAAYRAWRDGLITLAAEDPTLDPGAPTTLITATLALNEYVYSGQAAAGAAAVRRAFAARPQAAEAIVTLAREAAAVSRWRADLDALNGGDVQAALR